jgi:antitoxin CptB
LPDPLELRRKRLLFRAQHRGMKETDRLLGGFAAAHAAELGEAQIGRFEALLDENDNDVLAWILGQQPVPAAHDHDVMAMLRAFTDNR